MLPRTALSRVAFRRLDSTATRGFFNIFKTRDHNSKSVLNFMSQKDPLNNHSPDAAQIIKRIEHGWETGNIQFNENVLREYFKAVGHLKKFDNVNITALLQLLSKNGGNGKLPQNLSFTSAAGAGFGSGATANEPLYVNTTVSSGGMFKKLLVQTIPMLLGLTLVMSFIGGVLEEKSGSIGGAMSRMPGGGTAIHQAEHSDKSFADVVGIDEAKLELEEIVMYLKSPETFTRLGGKLPKGVLLTGPPGTGKTLLARAIAGEAGVPFFYSSGSEFEEMYVGVGARRVRDLFDAAKHKSPCIIFIDEIDAIGGSRHLKEQSAMKMTLNQLLVEMDGFEQNNGVIVIAATNFPETLDKALTRPGRLDKHVNVPLPDIGGRKAILELYGTKITMGSDVDIEQLARGTPGFSGAELFNMVNQAAIKASVDGLKAVGMAAFEYAKDKLMMGAERKTAIISPENMKVTAFHEAGHALVGLKTEGSHPIHKATIMPRGQSLGMVMQLPDGDQTSYSRKQMLADMDICMGGRVAEELIFGTENVTSGASSDIQQATNIARAMVTKWGMSEKVGFLTINDKDAVSGTSRTLIDAEIQRLLAESYARATKILIDNNKELHILANGLLDYETLSGGELVDLLAGIKPNQNPQLRSQRPSRASKPTPVKKLPAGRPGNESGGGPKGAPANVPTSSVAAPPPKSSASSPRKLSVVAPSANSVPASTAPTAAEMTKGKPLPSNDSADAKSARARGPPKE